MDGAPKRDTKIVALEAAIDDAKDILREYLSEIQGTCPHNVIFEVYRFGGDMRICSVCGREEHAPVYHSFLFTGLTAHADRLIVELNSSSDFYAMRVQMNSIKFHTPRGQAND